MNCAAEQEKTCIVCGEALHEDFEWEDRWSWGPDGLHCHYRCEAGFSRAVRQRTAHPPTKE